MSGYDNYNYDAFNAVEKRLKEEYSIPRRNIINPTHIANGEQNHQYSFYIKESLKLITFANTIVLLENWEQSKGAKMEALCGYLMNLNFLDHNIQEISKETITSKLNSLSLL